MSQFLYGSDARTKSTEVDLSRFCREDPEFLQVAAPSSMSCLVVVSDRHEGNSFSASPSTGRTLCIFVLTL